VCERANRVHVRPAPIDPSRRRYLSQRIVRAMTIQVHSRERHLCFGVVWTGGDHGLVRPNRRVPLRQRTAESVEARRQPRAFVSIRPGDGFGELPDGGDELILDLVNLRRGRPEPVLLRARRRVAGRRGLCACDGRHSDDERKREAVAQHGEPDGQDSTPNSDGKNCRRSADDSRSFFCTREFFVPFEPSW
jgi:hypothetical protein